MCYLCENYPEKIEDMTYSKLQSMKTLLENYLEQINWQIKVLESEE